MTRHLSFNLDAQRMGLGIMPKIAYRSATYADFGVFEAKLARANSRPCGVLIP